MKEVFIWFPSGEAVFVFSATLIALLVYITTFVLRIRDHKKIVNNIQRALKNEIMLNIDQIFTSKPENPLQYAAINEIRSKYLADVKDLELFDEIQHLYSQLEYYTAFVAAHYVTNIDRKGTVQRQLELQKYILNYFDIETAFFDDAGSHEAARDAIAIPLKEKYFPKWRKKLTKKLESLF